MKVIAFFILSIISFSVISQTIIPDSSVVSGNWTLSGSPYIVQGRAIIQQGQTLTIDPGVQVRFASNPNIYDPIPWHTDTNLVGRILVQGKIVANGTLADTICFIPDGIGYWGSLAVIGDSGSAFSYCKFNKMNITSDPINGWNTYRGLHFSSSWQLNISHLLFENNHYALTMYSGSVRSYVEYSVFRNNLDSNRGTVLSQSTWLWDDIYISNSIFDNSAVMGGNSFTIANSIVMNADSVGIWPNGTAYNRYNIINCLFYNNPKAFRGINEINIYNTIFLNNVAYDTAFGCCPWQFNNNVLDGPVASTWSVTTVNYPNTNPNLVNPQPVNGYFHLLPSSICVNNGDTAGISALIPNTDIEGNPRYNGVIDIGPYEYQGTTSKENSEKSSFLIYPSPSKGNFALIYSINENSAMEIINVAGEIVGKYYLPPGAFKIEITENHLQSGIYFYRVISKNSVLTTGKITIVH